MSHFPEKPRAVVTGAGSGLGRALALELARRGARVLATDVELATAEKTAREVTEAGGEGAALRCDVTRAEELEAVAQEADRRWGGVDVLVNNAGVAAAGKVGEAPLKDWEWIVQVNLWGVIYGCHAFVPRMRAEKRGWILNVASAAGITCLPEMASYNVTKAGVIALSETLRAELAPEGVKVSVLCPTFFATNLLDRFRAPQERYRKVAQRMFDRSRITAEGVAKEGLEGLERGRLFILPQADGRLAWYFKRLLPSVYSWSVARNHQRITDLLLRQATR